MSYDSKSLTDGIIKEAKDKAESIIKEANIEKTKILEGARIDSEKKKDEMQRSLDLRLSSLRQREESAKKSQDRLKEMKSLDASYSAVMKSVYDEISSMAKNGKLRPYLISWIAEAAIGLDKDDAIVSFCKDAKGDDSMLKEAEELIKERSGRSVSLSLDERFADEIGVVLYSLDRKISYNNLLSTRIRRREREIRQIVQEENAR